VQAPHERGALGLGEEAVDRRAQAAGDRGHGDGRRSLLAARCRADGAAKSERGQRPA
jgi:hypothetical protein